MKKAMKALFLYCLLPLATAIGVDAATNKYYRNKKKRAIRHGHYASKEAVREQKHFVLIVPSFNNKNYVQKNLDSILSQEYENFRVIYINDASTDNTIKVARDYVNKKECANKVHFIDNQSNKGALANIYQAVQTCQDEEIVVICDGDDWLCHPKVLEKLNAYYANSDTWLTWGNYKEYPNSTTEVCLPVDKKVLTSGSVRKEPWCFSHLRTFYASLFKKINKEDLMHNGAFYSTCYDLAIMFPMLEMAREHAYFTKDIFYIYNRETPINDDKIKARQQRQMDHILRNKPIYTALDSL
jgi:glycosyltransferase involved in cell wall biosynthesis